LNGKVELGEENWARIFDVRLRISGIAALYLFMKPIEYLKSAIHNLKSEILA